MDAIYRLYKNTGDGSSKNILQAIMNNDCCYVIDYYELGKDILYSDKKGDTFLHKACRNDNFDIIDLLLKLGCDVNARNNNLETPLHLAVQFRNAEASQKLLLEHANPNAFNKQKVAPLHIAASRGDVDILNLLLNYGAKLNISDYNGEKPIHYAVKSGKIEMIRHLLSSGASLVECDDRKNTALHYACQKGDENIVAYILRHMTITNFPNIYKETPMHLAAVYCTPTTIALLLEKGYDLDSINNNGNTPIDEARLNGNKINYDYLINAKRSSEYKEKYLDYKMHRAVCENKYEYLVQFVNSQNINDFDYFGKSMMYYAIICGNLKITKFLYKKGAKIDIVDDHRQPALLIAVYAEHFNVIKYLLTLPVDVNEIFYGRSYLYRAILRNNYEMASILIEAGANVNFIDSKHRTIYSYAIDYASDDIIDLLIRRKASFI